MTAAEAIAALRPSVEEEMRTVTDRPLYVNRDGKDYPVRVVEWQEGTPPPAGFMKAGIILEGGAHFDSGPEIVPERMPYPKHPLYPDSLPTNLVRMAKLLRHLKLKWLRRFAASLDPGRLPLVVQVWPVEMVVCKAGRSVKVSECYAILEDEGQAGG